MFVFFFFKQKTSYEMRISDWSSDVCSSDLTDGELTSTATVSIRVDPSDQFDDYRQGGSGTDVLIGNLLGNNKILGGAGNDILTGSLRAAELAGGDGNEFMLGLRGADQFWGGQGDGTLGGGLGHDSANFF